MPERFIIGVNYWPRRKAMWWWKQFAGREVEEEFTQIRDLGLELVRFFLLWEDFQPQPQVISEPALHNLAVVFEIAARLGLRLMPTLLVGHMSGPNWMPPWTLSRDRARNPFPVISGGGVRHRFLRNIYEDPEMLEAQALLIRTVVKAMKGQPALYAWDLTNEINFVQVPRQPEAAAAWVNRLRQEAKAIDPVHPLTCGVLLRDLMGLPGFCLDDVSSSDFISVHAYPPWTQPTLDASLAPSHVQRVQETTGKPVFLTEFGVPTVKAARPVEIAWAGSRWRQYLYSEEDAAAYYRQVLTKTQALGCLGALAWCFSDYDPSLYGRLPFRGLIHERHFGLTRADGSLKPVALVLREFASYG